MSRRRGFAVVAGTIGGLVLGGGVAVAAGGALVSSGLHQTPAVPSTGHAVVAGTPSASKAAPVVRKAVPVKSSAVAVVKPSSAVVHIAAPIQSVKVVAPVTDPTPTDTPTSAYPQDSSSGRPAGRDNPVGSAGVIGDPYGQLDASPSAEPDTSPTVH